MTKELALPARMDFAALDALYAEIKEARGEDITLDASKVGHLGSCGLQLLIAARKSWDQDGHTLAISAPSGKFSDHLHLLGLDDTFFVRAGS